MEIPVTAGPWLVLGVVLGVLVPLLAAVALALPRRRPGADPPPPAAVDPGVHDDLPGFLEFPPGSAPAPPATAAPWPALSSPSVAPPEPTVPGDADRSGLRLVVAMVVGALLLVGAAAAVAAARPSDRAADARPAGTTGRDDAPGPAAPDGVTADLTFGGIVLERYAVGVTVAYPRVRVTVEPGRTRAEIELPTFNCLRPDAPEDPEAAGCTRSATEVAELSTPGLDARRVGEGVRVSGAFATSRLAAGSAPVATGRVYDVVVSASPRDGRRTGGRTPATGMFEIGDEQVRSGDDAADVLVHGE